MAGGWGFQFARGGFPWRVLVLMGVDLDSMEVTVCTQDQCM
jgi:hypothetical protein